MDRVEYVQERNFLAQLEAESYRGFDKTLLALSSGAIALSVTFIEKFDIARCPDLLVLAWVSWIISIFLQLISYIVASKAMREEQVILNEQYREYEKDARKNPYSGVSTQLNIAALTAFAIGVLVFLLFVVSRIY